MIYHITTRTAGKTYVDQYTTYNEASDHIYTAIHDELTVSVTLIRVNNSEPLNDPDTSYRTDEAFEHSVAASLADEGLRRVYDRMAATAKLPPLEEIIRAACSR